MIYVCDAIMGTGKSSAAINYINAHPEEKFIYITPFNEEAKRIAKACSASRFYIPSIIGGLKYSGRPIKSEDFKRLVESGTHIATSHALFRLTTDETLEIIKNQGYILIIDENMDAFEVNDVKSKVGNISEADLNMLLASGYLVKKMSINEMGNEVIAYEAAENLTYTGGRFDSLFRKLRSQTLSSYSRTDEDGKIYQLYWNINPSLVTSFKDTFILTYLFEYQGLSNMFTMYKISFKTIGVSKTDKGYEFNFGPPETFYVPEYTSRIKSLLHVLDDKKLNAIGTKKTALSMNWYKHRAGAGKHGGAEHKDIDTLRKNIYNCFANKWPDSSEGSTGKSSRRNVKRLCSVYADYEKNLTGPGYRNNWLSFNARATNEYKDAEYLVYAVNLHENADRKKMCRVLGVKLNDDVYALSTMIQWIWRSAIREGKPVHLYLPSSRMRRLLSLWMDDLENGGDGHCLSVGTASGMIPISVTRDMAV